LGSVFRPKEQQQQQQQQQTDLSQEGKKLNKDQRGEDTRKGEKSLPFPEKD